MATKAARNKPPEAYIGAFGLASPALTATIGAQRPAMRFRHEAMPVPVPRFGAGNTSGVLLSLSIQCPQGLGGNHSLGVKHTVHDILEKGFQTSESKLEVWIRRNCETEDEDPGYQGRNCDSSFSTNIFNIDGIICNERTWYTDNRSDCVVSVDNSCRRRCITASILKILREKCIEQRIGHSNRGPTEPDKASLDQNQLRKAHKSITPIGQDSITW
ncbi:MAG: hypothetical protein Q9214_002385 [Letrouitia sp. 1 TL-2023]